MDASTIESLLSGFYNLSWQGIVMIAVGILLIPGLYVVFQFLREKTKGLQSSTAKPESGD